MRVAFISRDGLVRQDGTFIPGGTTHLRAIVPARALTTFGGIDTVFTHTFGQDQRTGEIKPRLRLPDGSWELLTGYDVIVFIRWMNAPGIEYDMVGRQGAGDHIATVTQRAQAYGQYIVQDLDDWLWGVPTTNVGFYGIHARLNPGHNVNHYKKALAKADLVTVSTAYLKERLSHLPVPIKVLTNMIELDKYTPAEVRPGPAQTIGWTGSTIYRGSDLETLRGVLGPFMRKHGLRFIHGGWAGPGSPSVRDMLGLGDVEIEERHEVLPDLYPTLFRDMDIFICPLADRPFNHAKSACKAMEASAAGVPLVAQAIRPYLDYNGVSVARKPKDWLRALEALLDPVYRRFVRGAQLARVQDEDVSRRWTDWADAYKG